MSVSSGAPRWAQAMDAGIAGLVAELESARDNAADGGGVVDWPTIISKARGLGSHLGSAEADYRGLVTDANKRLSEASKQIGQLQSQIRPGGPGVGAPGTGLGSGQTVYISAGATAGIAAGALLLGGVGGYAAKTMLDTRKKKKAKEAAEAAEAAGEDPEELDNPAPQPRKIKGKTR